MKNTIIDTKAAIKHHFDETGVKITQKDIAEEALISEQNLSKWNKTAPQVVGEILKIQEITGAPLEVIIKSI